MNTLQELETLESLPLLGAQKLQAIELADRIALEVNPDLQPNLALRLLIRRFLAQPNSADTLAQLSTAEAWATSEGETLLALKLQLIWCRYVGLTDPDAVPRSLLNAAIDKAKAEKTLEAEWRLALAAVDLTDSITLRQDALKYLQEPESVHEKLRVHLELADDRTKGADAMGTLKHLESAYSIAMTHQDPGSMCTCATRIGLHYIERGLPTKATAYLEHALALANSENRDLDIVINATLLSTLYLQAKEFALVERMADMLLVSGARRANWFAVADGHIMHSSLSLMEGNLAEAIDRLVRAILKLQQLVPGAAINTLKGRLAELRNELGADVFDPHYQQAIRVHRPA